jgi:phospholipid-binding lipoprotein MlaA
MFKFNDHLDDFVAKPISDVYLWATPRIIKTGVTNFFSNLKDINVVLNDHMQGKFEQGSEDTGRLLANSTLGLLGFFDVASDLGLTKHEEDFGQTLAVWGVPQGAYLVLPLLGPTTTRGLPGGVVDAAANPTFYVGMPVQLVSMLNSRANAEGALKFIDEAAIDPYVFTREAYLQNQKHLISDGNITATVNVLPLEDEIFNDADESDSKVAKSSSSAETSKNQSESAGSPHAAGSPDNAVSVLGGAGDSLPQTTEKPHKKAHKKHRKPNKLPE